MGIISWLKAVGNDNALDFPSEKSALVATPAAAKTEPTSTSTSNQGSLVENLDFPSPDVFTSAKSMSSPDIFNDANSVSYSDASTSISPRYYHTYPTPDQVADFYINQLQASDQRYTELCLLLGKREGEIMSLKSQVFSLNNSLAGLRKQNDLLMTGNQNLYDESMNLNAMVSNLKQQLQQQGQANGGLRLHNEKLSTTIKQQLVQMEDMQFDLEYARCTRPSMVPNDGILSPQPFVVVLVDGDAYGVSPSLTRRAPFPSPLLEFISFFRRLTQASGRETYLTAPPLPLAL
jgi:regulator of replication initiation timing